MSQPCNIVFDLENPAYLNNRIFEREVAAKFPGASWIPVFAEKAKSRGWAVMTPDKYLSEPDRKAESLVISEMRTRFTNELVRRGAKPLVMYCGESPNVAWRFYHDLGRQVAPFRYFISFGGVRSRVPTTTSFKQLYWPNQQADFCGPDNWSARRYLVMVASNKKRNLVDDTKGFSSLRKAAKPLFWKYLQTTDPLFRFEDLYERRINAIEFFCRKDGFKLFGRGWSSDNLSSRHREAALAAGASPVEDKIEALRKFKFSLCFENCVFPGYVTEKIFDCFVAGCIPAYWGAPDIADFVPKATFVDCRQFQDFSQLDLFLRNLTESAAGSYLSAARNFLSSADFEKYLDTSFVDRIFMMLQEGA